MQDFMHVLGADSFSTICASNLIFKFSSIRIVFESTEKKLSLSIIKGIIKQMYLNYVLISPSHFGLPNGHMQRGFSTKILVLFLTYVTTQVLATSLV
jgi:hypothetical protein